MTIPLQKMGENDNIPDKLGKYSYLDIILTGVMYPRTVFAVLLLSVDLQYAL